VLLPPQGFLGPGALRLAHDVCLALGVFLAGAGFSESLLMCIAVINLHHFVVDAYIWRLRVPQNQKALADRPSPVSV